MKKFLALIMAVFIMLSCTSDAFKMGDSGNTKTRIVFSSGTKPVTRAIVNTASDMDAGTIGVYCCVDGIVAPNDGKDYMSNVAITKSGSYWLPADNYYWVNGKTMNFFAYYPYAAGTVRGTGADSEKIKIAVDLGQDAKNVDLLYAIKDSVYNDVAGENTSTDIAAVIVPLNFQHAFAQIEFDAKAGTNFSEVTIDSIWFEIPTTQGDFEITTTTGSVATAFVPAASQSPVKYEYADIDIVRTASNNYADFTKIGSEIVVPQSSNINVVIKYTASVLGIPYTQRRKVVNLKDVIPVGTAPGALNSSNDTADNWVAGHKYIYHIIIDPADIIKFSVSVTDWTTGADSHWTIL